MSVVRVVSSALLATALLAPVIVGVDEVAADSPSHQIQRNVVYGMYSGLALLMGVHLPSKPNGYGILHISGSSWRTGLSYDAKSIKDGGGVALSGWPLVEAGYTEFTINHRAIPRFRYPDQLHDIQRSVRYIRHNASEWGIDPDHIGAIGGSSGGHLVSLLATGDGTGNPDVASEIDHVSSAVQCVVARAPITNLTVGGVGWALLGFPAGADSTTQEYQPAWEASPIKHVNASVPPTLVVHGGADERVPIERSEAFATALRDLGVTVELRRVDGAGHGSGFPGSQIPLSRIQGWYVDWFDRHLKTE